MDEVIREMKARGRQKRNSEVANFIKLTIAAQHLYIFRRLLSSCNTDYLRWKINRRAGLSYQS